MSTLELEHLKHSSASGNNITLAADGSLSKIHVKSAASGATADAGADELVVEGSGNTGITIASGASSSGSIYFADSGSAYDGWINYSQTDRKLNFATAQTTRMSIDANGAVSKPNNPGFYARHTTARVYTNGYLYDFTITWEQGGSNLATATGIYTAPASGVYQVNLMLGNQYNSGAGNYKIYVNNAYYNGFTFDGIDNQSGWVTSTLCGLIKINANDTVRIWCNSTGHPDNSDWSAWSMYMVG